MTHAVRTRRAGSWLLALTLACGTEGTDEGSTPAVVDVEPRSGAPEQAAPASAFELPGLAAARPRPRFTWPVQSVHLTSSFGWRVDPVSGRGVRLHRGVDFRGATGDLVLSIGPGRVEFVGHDPLLGNMVVVDHGDGLQSLYGHLSDVLVVADVPVDRGAALGLVGNTGRSAAPHLHLTVKLDGVAIDPLEIIGEPLHHPRALVGPGEAAAAVDVAPAALEPSSTSPGLADPSSTRRTDASEP